MDQPWWNPFVWVSLALVASLISWRIGVSVALVELFLGVVAGNTFHPPTGDGMNFLASTGALVLTFLAGAELDLSTVKRFWKQSLLLGLIVFAAPFALVWGLTEGLLGWERASARIVGSALSTTSVAVVYAVMLETSLNETPLGKLILAACSVNDLGTVASLVFSLPPSTFGSGSSWASPCWRCRCCPELHPTAWPGSARTRANRGSDACCSCCSAWAGRRAGWEQGGIASVPSGHGACGYVQLTSGTSPAHAGNGLRSAHALLLPAGGELRVAPSSDGQRGPGHPVLPWEAVAKFIGLFPAGMAMRMPNRANLYTTLMMSTGLTFGTISALYCLTHGLIPDGQYSVLVVVVILTALIPTVVAQAFVQPRERERGWVLRERKRETAA